MRARTAARLGEAAPPAPGVEPATVFAERREAAMSKANGPLVNPCWSGDHADAKLAEALVLVAEATGLLDAGGFTGNAPVDLNLVGPAQDIVAALCALRVSLHDVQVVRTREQCR